MYTPLDKELYDAPAKQAVVDPMTGMPTQQEEMTNVPSQQEEMTNALPQQYNTMGNAKPLFSDQTKQIADNMFGQQIPGTFGSALAKKNCNKKY